MIANDSLPGICRVACQIDGECFVFAFNDTEEARDLVRVEVAQMAASKQTTMTWAHAAWLNTQIDQALPIGGRNIVSAEACTDEP